MRWGWLLLGAGLLAGCSSGTAGGAAAAAQTPAAVPSSSCGTPGPAAPVWPLAVPESVPKPPGSQIFKTTVSGPTTYVYFRTPTTLRDSTLYLVKSLREAGYTISRGDAEATEADAPFVGPTIVGAIRLTLTSDCVTTWTLAVEPRQAQLSGTVPTLIPYHPGASARPLPFG